MLERFTIFIVCAIICALLLGFPIMWLWNAILPYVCGASAITFWQALGLCLLCNLLFGNHVTVKK